jgi:hypothetical protein
MRVTGATAEIAIDAMGDLLAGRTGIILQKLDARHDHAGGAIAALQTVTFPKAFLDGMELTVASQTFHRRYFGAIGLDGEEGARLDGFAVEQDCARSANAGFASDVRACESAKIAKEVNQERPRLDFVLLRRTIDANIYNSFHRCHR